MTTSENNNNNNNSDPKKERIRQESTVLLEFSQALQRQVQQIRSRIGPHSKLGLSPEEIRAVNGLFETGNMEGLIAGVATFVFLRKFPKYLRGRVRNKSQGYTLEQPGTAPNSPFRNSRTLEQQPPPPPPQPGIVWRSFQFTLDVTISALVGLQVASYMMDRERIANTIAGIPLLEGQSALSDHFCGVMVEEYKRQWNFDPATNNDSAAQPGSSIQTYEDSATANNKKLPPFDRKDILRNPEMEALKVVLGFAQNCQKRQALERQIRQERGMAANEPVAIPSPGVPSGSDHHWNEDGALDNNYQDDGAFGSSSGGEKYLNGDEGEDDEWSKEDVSSFVSDQEDDWERKK